MSVSTIYIELDVLEHERTKKILARHPKAQRIVIEKYSEVFNPKAQNFRLQKTKPALILANKHNARVLPTPEKYQTGGDKHYYFSHMLNCIYDCRYCFLQGMYRSANYLVFVNYEEFISDIETISTENPKDKIWFFSGYDCDSLAYEPVTGFAEYFVPKFANYKNAILELRTKSTQIRAIAKLQPIDNVVVAYSLSPQEIVQAQEHGTPSLIKRLDAIKTLQSQGWKVGIRFDPVIWHENYQAHYLNMVNTVFNTLDVEQLDSVTLGGFRLPRDFYKKMAQLYPEEWLFTAGLDEQQGMITYKMEIEQEMLDYVADKTRQYIQADKLFVYPSYQS